MAYINTYTFKYRSSANINYVLEFYDQGGNASTWADEKGTLGAKNCTISFGSENAKMYSPLKPSTLTIDFMVTGVLDANYLKQLRDNRQERDVYVYLYNTGASPVKIPGDSPIFAGYLLMDLAEDPDISVPFPMKLRAIDGLASLKYYDFIPHGKDQRPDHLYPYPDTWKPGNTNTFDKFYPFRQWISRILRYSGYATTAAGSATDAEIQISVNWFNGNMPNVSGDPLDWTRATADQFYTAEGDTGNIRYRPLTCYDALQFICKTWGMRCFAYKNTFYFIGINTYTENNGGTLVNPQNINWHRYTITGAAASPATGVALDLEWGRYQPTVFIGEPNQKLAGSRYGVLPAFKRVSVDFLNISNINYFQGFPKMPQPWPITTGVGTLRVEEPIGTFDFDGTNLQTFFQEIYLNFQNSSGGDVKYGIRWHIIAKKVGTTTEYQYGYPNWSNNNLMPEWFSMINVPQNTSVFSRGHLMIPPGPSSFNVITDLLNPAWFGNSINMYVTCPPSIFTAGDWEFKYVTATEWFSGSQNIAYGHGRCDPIPNPGVSYFTDPDSNFITYTDSSITSGVGSSFFSPIANGIIGTEETNTQIVQSGLDTDFEEVTDVLWGDLPGGGAGRLQVYNGTNWVPSGFQGFWGIDSLTGNNSLAETLCEEIFKRQAQNVRKFSTKINLDAEDIYARDPSGSRAMYGTPFTKWFTPSHAGSATISASWIMHTGSFDTGSDTWSFSLYEFETFDKGITTTTTGSNGSNSGGVGNDNSTGSLVPSGSAGGVGKTLANPARNNSRAIAKLMQNATRPVTVITENQGLSAEGTLTVTSLTVQAIPNAVLKAGDTILLMCQYQPDATTSLDETNTIEFGNVEFVLSSDQSAGATTLSVVSKTIYQIITKGDIITISQPDLIAQYQNKTKGSIASLPVTATTIGSATDAILIDNGTNKRIGIGKNPTTPLDVLGIINATTFTGDLDGTINTTTTGTTQSANNNSTKIATTAYVDAATASVPKGLQYQGTWNAATNTPTIVSGTGVVGYYYIVATPGTTTIDGISEWALGDWIIFTDHTTDHWQKIDQSESDTLQSVTTRGATTTDPITVAGLTTGGNITVSGTVDGRNVSTDGSQLDSNTTNIASNTSSISTNTSNISTNTSSISTNTGNISTNTTNIASNASAIATKAAAATVTTNTTNIASNETDIGTNQTDIATNVTAIASKANATTVATNTSAIATNTSNVSANTTDIATNTSAIATKGSATDVSTNATNIATNVTDIATNVTDIATNVTAIATKGSATDVSTNATNIATNATDISTNTTAIATKVTLTGNETIAGTKSFSSIINANEGINIVGGSIGSGKIILHTNNLMYIRGGSAGLMLQNGDGGAAHQLTSSGNQIFEASGEKMRLVTGGQLLIGHFSSYYAGTKLQVGHTTDSQNGLQITTSTSGYGYVLFGDGTGADAYVGQIAYKHSDNTMRFRANATESFIIKNTGIDIAGNIVITGTVDGRDVAADGTQLDTNTSAISTNTGNISTNTTNIATNTSSIATKASATSVSTNTANIATNTSNISSNNTDITTNTTNITSNASNIQTNATNITSNDTDISTNATNISTNVTNIATNATDISGKASSSSVTTNTSNITTNTGNIATNTTNITTNATTLATKAAAATVTTNTSNISTNETDIASNATDIATNVTAIASKANATSVATNTSNISTNTSNISTNTSNISTNTGNISTNVNDIVTNNTIANAALPKDGGIITGNVTFNDDNKAIFGTSNDGLEIYHNGSNSYIDETGTGSLYIRSAGAIRLQSDTGENMIYAVNDGAVNLYHNNVNKLQTTSTGVNISGELEATSLDIVSGTWPPNEEIVRFYNGFYDYRIGYHSRQTVSHSFQIYANSTIANINWNSGILKIGTETNSNLEFYTGDTTALTLDSSQNATFAGDVIVGPKNNAVVQVSESGGATVKMLAGSVGRIGTYTDDELRIVTDGNDRLTISNTGNATFAGRVTIGTVDTLSGGHLNIGEASPTIQLFDTTNDAKLLIYTQDSSSIIGTYSNHSLFFFTNSTQALKLDTLQNATFAGNVTLNDGSVYITQSIGTETFKVTTVYDRVGKFVSTDAGAFLAIQDNTSTDNGVGINVTGDTLKLLTANTPALTVDASQNATFAGTVNIVGTNSTNQESVLLRGITASGSDLLGSIRTANTGGYNQEMRFYTSNANGTTDEDLTLTLHPNQNATFAGIVTAATTFLADDVDPGNPSPTTNNLRVSGYGIIGNRGAVYVTNAGTTATDSVQIGVGGVHAAATKLLINSSNSIFSTAIKAGADSTYDIGTSLTRFKDAYVDSINVTGEVEGGSLDINGNTQLGGGTLRVSTDSSFITSYSYTLRDGVGINNPNSSSFAVSSTTVMAVGAMSGGTVNTSLITTGAIGVGIASPGAMLDVNGEVQATSLDINGNADITGNLYVNSGGIVLQQAYNLNLGVSGYDLKMPNTTSIILSTAGITALTLDNSQNATFSGNIGIKETSIDANLHITDTNPNIKFEINGTKKWAMGVRGTDFIIDDVNDDLSTYVLKLAADNTATFSGNIAIDQTKKVLFDGDGGHTYILEESDSNLKFYVAGVEQLNITNGGLHFNASLTIPDYINHASDTGTKFGFSDNDTFVVRTGGAVRLTVNDTNATFAGTITSGAITSSASVIASGNSNSFGNTTVGALSASSGTFSASVTAAGNSNSFGNTTFAGTISTPSSFNFTGNNGYIKVGTSWNTGVLHFLNGSTTYLQFDVPNGRIQNNLGSYLTASSGTAKFGSFDNQSMSLVTNNTARLTINTSGNATFAGNVNGRNIADDGSQLDTNTSAIAAKAPIASPTFTGSPAAPTASAGTNNTKIATTAFVTAAVAAGGGGTVDRGSFAPSAVQSIGSGGVTGTKSTLTFNTSKITAVGLSIASTGIVTIENSGDYMINLNFGTESYLTQNRILGAAELQYSADGEEWVAVDGSKIYTYNRGIATGEGASTWGTIYEGSGHSGVIQTVADESFIRVQFWVDGRSSSSTGMRTVLNSCRLSLHKLA